MPGQTRAHEFFSPEERLQSSTMRELLGVRGSLQAFLPLCQGVEVYLHTDSQNVVFIQHRGSKKIWLNDVAKQLFWFCLEHHIVLHINWVPKELNQHVGDASKLLDSSNWQLHPEMFSFLDGRWGPHSVDPFASSINA